MSEACVISVDLSVQFIKSFISGQADIEHFLIAVYIV
jgi:hypothetical protein